MNRPAVSRGALPRARLFSLFSTLALASVCLVALLALFARTARAVDCNVPAGYATIQDAIDEPTCTTIYIASGIYVENLTIDRDVALIGAGASSTAIDGGALDGVIEINSGSVVISGTRIQNGYRSSGDGGGIDNAGALLLSESIVSNNYVTDTVFGAGIYNSGILTVAHSFIRYNRGELGVLFGGGIYNAGTAWILSDTIVSFNALDATQTFGGGVYNGGVMTISNSIVRNNAITGSISYGGGIQNAGDLMILDSIVRNNTVDASIGYGGGIQNNLGVVTILDSVVRDNAVDASIGYGGGIYNGADMTVDNVNLTNNNGDESGGGLYNAGELALLDSRLVDNLAGDGGGVYATMTTTLTATSVMSNTAGDSGGGIYNSGLMLVQDSAVAYNAAAGSGGGFYASDGSAELQSVTLADNVSSGDGGAIAQLGGHVTATNVTISSNEGDSASSDGGAWYVDGSDSTAAISSSTIVSNSVAGAANSGGLFLDDGITVTLKNTIVAFNSNVNCEIDGLLESAGHNLESDDDCGLNAAGDITNSDPLLGALADNGGDTRTHALLPGSPAVDAGDSAACPPTDQRGVSRDSGAACDIGAYEAVQFSVSDSAYPEGDGGAATMPVTITLSAASPISEQVVISTTAGTASPGSDYDNLNALVQFASGEVQQTVLITVYGDTEDEQNETFIATLDNSPGTHIGDGQATGTIVDDDGPQISIDDVALSEGDAGTVTASFTVVLSAASPQPISVDYTTADGTAHASSDYTATSGTLTFTSGDTAETIEVLISGDLLQEPDETFSVELSNATNASLGDASGAGLIQDDDLVLYLPVILNMQ